MKYVLILVGFCISTQGFNIPEKLVEDSNLALAKWISQAFVGRLQKEMMKELLPRVPVFPPLDDPAILETIEQPLNISIPTMFESDGHFTYITPEVRGLSHLTDELVIGLVGNFTIQWDLAVPTVAFKGQYDLDQTVTADSMFGKPGPHTFNGRGEFLAGVDNVFFKLEASGDVLDRLQVDIVSVDFGFQNLTGHAENTEFDGDLTSLDNLIRVLETIFNLSWTEKNKLFISEAVRFQINNAIGGCTTTDVVEGNLNCLNGTFPTPTPSDAPSTIVTQLPTTSSEGPSTGSPTSSRRPLPPGIDIDIDINFDVDVNIDIN